MQSTSTSFRLRRALTLIVGTALLAVLAAGCGGKIDVAKKDEKAATLFNERCSGCHSLDSANAYGSKAKNRPREAGERTDGPNFNVRKEKHDDVLFAIRNGGFSGAIMPANIVTGRQAQELATFLSKYAGAER